VATSSSPPGLQPLATKNTEASQEGPPSLPSIHIIKAAHPQSAGMPVGDVLHRVFGHDQFRPFQENVCLSMAGGKDALLVMPTGAGGYRRTAGTCTAGAFHSWFPAREHRY